MGKASPDLALLGGALGEVLPGAVVLSRQANVRSSSFLSEVVTCRLPGAEELRLFCKYGAGADEATGYGHRGGVAYEAQVYRDLLQPLGVRTVPFDGTHFDPDTGTTWLVLGFQPGWCIDMRLDLAARWIGEFQRAATARFRDRPPAWLKRYDPAYYASGRAGRWSSQKGSGWACTGCRRCATVDWESAAFGAGEIDMASLTEGWSAADLDECLREYAAAPGPKDPRRISPGPSMPRGSTSTFAGWARNQRSS